MLGKLFENIWYSNNKLSFLSCLSYLLWPFSLLFIFIVTLRRFLLKAIYSSKKFPVPVIVVGNITVGGTGKTPLVIHIVNLLKKHGKNPAIIIRGYKGGNKKIKLVDNKSTVFDVGDEAFLLSKFTKVKVMVGANRREACKKLLEIDKNIDVIISDDGLQHYKLPRDIEIAVTDDMKCFGNGFCLPAGPLRELPSRLKSVNYLIINERDDAYSKNNLSFRNLEEIQCQARNDTTMSSLKDTTMSSRKLRSSYPGSIFKKMLKKYVKQQNIFSMELVGNKVFNLSNTNHIKFLKDFKNQKVHAVSGIGNNESFFDKLLSFGIDVVPHPFLDHYNFKEADLDFDDDLLIIMTSKDAVKCREFKNEKIYVYPVNAKLSENFDAKLMSLLKRKTPLSTRIKDVLSKYKRKEND